MFKLTGQSLFPAARGRLLAIVRRGVLLAAAGAALHAPVSAQNSPRPFASAGDCGSLAREDGGPWDYRSDPIKRLKTVERYHFTPQVEMLLKGESSARIGMDLDFTLRSFPNHHRALLSMMRLGAREGRAKPDGAQFSVECWFERALRFQPDDAVARMLYVTFLNRAGRLPEARDQLGQVTAAAGDNPFTHYNAGLLYLEMKDYPNALAQAHISYGMGMGRPELRDQLVKAGQWREPAAAASSPASDPNRP